MKLMLPNKRFLVVIILLSLIGPAQYALNFLNPPSNSVFVGYSDDALMLAVMDSPANNFNDPWSFDGGKIWHNPLAGSVYLFLVLGFIPSLLKIDMYSVFIFLKFVFAIIYYLVVYNLILYFIKNEKQQKIAFLFFTLVAGIGGIIYILSSVIFSGSEFLPVIGYAFTREFDELAAVAHSLTHLFRLYYVIPETLGYLSLLLFVKNRKVLAGISLGFAFIFYPMHGISFSLVLLIYTLVKNKASLIQMIKQTVLDILPTYIIAMVFLIPMFIHAAERPYYFTVSRLVFEAMSPLNLLVSFFFAIIFGFYYFYKKPAGLLKNKKFMVVFIILAVLFVVENLYPTALTSTIFSRWLNLLGLYNMISFIHTYSFFIEMAILALSFVIITSLLKSGINPTIKFLAIWALLLFVLSGIDPSYMGRVVNPLRFAPSIIFPLSVLASFGVLLFSRNFSMKLVKIMAIIILLSIPSLLGYNLWLQKSVRNDMATAFYTHDEYDALLFLKNQSYGHVFASLRYCVYIPYYSEKGCVAFSGRNYTGLLHDVKTDTDEFFLPGTSVERRKEVLEKYGIKYVFIGKNEKNISLPSGLIKIREGENEIYVRSQ